MLEHIGKINDSNLKLTMPTEMCLFETDIHEYVMVRGRIYFNKNTYKVIISSMSYSNKWVDDNEANKIDVNLEKEMNSLMDDFDWIYSDLKSMDIGDEDGIYLNILETTEVLTNEMIKSAYFETIKEIKSGVFE
jgi:hypothetical protein